MNPCSVILLLCYQLLWIFIVIVIVIVIDFSLIHPILKRQSSPMRLRREFLQRGIVIVIFTVTVIVVVIFIVVIIELW